MVNKNYKYWEKILSKELQLLWNKSDKFLPCHGPGHHLRVWRMAKPFGLKKGVDMEVLVASCFLHDTYCFYIGTPKGHDTGSAKIANKILRKIKFPPDKIKQVMAAINSHRSKVRSNSLEGNILKSFDKIDAFGPVGVYRVIAPFSIRGYGVEEIAGWAIQGKRLEKKWNSIVFPELKKKYRKRYVYSKNYFSDLARDLGIKKLPKRNILDNRIYSRK